MHYPQLRSQQSGSPPFSWPPARPLPSLAPLSGTSCHFLRLFFGRHGRPSGSLIIGSPLWSTPVGRLFLPGRRLGVKINSSRRKSPANIRPTSGSAYKSVSHPDCKTCSRTTGLRDLPQAILTPSRAVPQLAVLIPQRHCTNIFRLPEPAPSTVKAASHARSSRCQDMKNSPGGARRNPWIASIGDLKPCWGGAAQ